MIDLGRRFPEMDNAELVNMFQRLEHYARTERDEEFVKAARIVSKAFFDEMLKRYPDPDAA